MTFRVGDPEVCTEFSETCTEFSEACTEFSEKCSFDVGIHDVFGNGAVARMFFTFSSSQNSGNSFLFELADLEFDSEINETQES